MFVSLFASVCIENEFISFFAPSSGAHHFRAFLPFGPFGQSHINAKLANFDRVKETFHMVAFR